MSWQLVPVEVERMLKSNQPEKIENMMRAMFDMKKLNLAKLKEAFAA